MRITGHESDQVVLKELGYRIKQYRISLNITQAELADKCGISPSTETRVENGEDSKLSNYLKILRGLGLLQNTDILVPDAQPNFKNIYEQKPPRRRVRLVKARKSANWIWGEDKKKE